jgi:biopolymer transport protein ExbB/TolQ
MYVNLLVSIFTLIIILQRVYRLFFLHNISFDAFSQRLSALVNEGNFSQAIQICSHNHPLMKIVKVALFRANKGERDIRRAVEMTAVEELARFKYGTHYLPQLANLATLIGLLGTIHGLIVAFRGSAEITSTLVRQAALSKGIAIAFYNTFFGLTIAIMAIFGFMFLSSRQSKMLSKMEATTSQVIDDIVNKNAAQKGHHLSLKERA